MALKQAMPLIIVVLRQHRGHIGGLLLRRLLIIWNSDVLGKGETLENAWLYLRWKGVPRVTYY